MNRTPHLYSVCTVGCKGVIVLSQGRGEGKARPCQFTLASFRAAALFALSWVAGLSTTGRLGNSVLVLGPQEGPSISSPRSRSREQGEAGKAKMGWDLNRKQARRDRLGSVRMIAVGSDLLLALGITTLNSYSKKLGNAEEVINYRVVNPVLSHRKPKIRFSVRISEFLLSLNFFF